MKAVITGANRGIGLEFCKQLKDLRYDVIAICRTMSPELEKLNVQVIENVDVRDVDNLKTVKEKINEPIDLLINNAGILIQDDLKSLNFKTIQDQIEVNSLGPLKVTLALTPLMRKNTKIVMITSRLGSIASTSDANYYGYRASKAALNMISKTLSIELKPKGIAIGIFHPGYVSTDMTDHKGDLDPEVSVKNMLKIIENLDLKNSGTFWHEDGSTIPW